MLKKIFSFKINKDFSPGTIIYAVNARWFIVSLFLIAAIIFRNDFSQKILNIIIGCCIFEFLHNILIIWGLKFYKDNRLTLFYISPFIDMLVIIVGVYLSGSISNFPELFYVIPIIYAVPIISASIIVSINAGILVAVIVSLLLIGLTAASFFQSNIPVLTLFLIAEKIAYFLIIVLLSIYIVFLANKKNKELHKENNVLLQENKKLKSDQESLIQREKIASITQITVSLNHEINNPLTCVLADIQISLLKAKKITNDDKLKKTLISCLQAAETQALLIKELMEDLRSITNPVVEEYIPGISMVNIKKSTDKKSA